MYDNKKIWFEKKHMGVVCAHGSQNSLFQNEGNRQFLASNPKYNLESSTAIIMIRKHHKIKTSIQKGSN